MEIEKANADFISHARPIAVAVLAMEAPAELLKAVCDVHYGKDTLSKIKTSDYREAISHFNDSRISLMEILHGIRDNYRCDNLRDYPLDTSTLSQAELDAIEEWNRGVDEGLISVEKLLDTVEGE